MGYMKTRNSVLALALLAAFASGARSAQAQQAEQVQQAQPTLTLYQGAQINGRVATTVDTGTAHVGDHFLMDVVPPYPSGDPAFQGATIACEITSVTPAGQGTKPSLGVQFDYLRLADGSTADIAATMTADQRKQDEGNGLHAALATLGGMFLGNAIGQTIFHTGGGGAVGAAGGLLYGVNKKTNFQLPAGSNVQITLNQTVTIRRQSP